MWLLYDIVIGFIVNELKGDELFIVFDGLLGLVFFVVFVDKDFKYFSEMFKICIVLLLIILKLIKDCFENYYCKSGVLFVGNLCFEEIIDFFGKFWF